MWHLLCLKEANKGFLINTEALEAKKNALNETGQIMVQVEE